MCISTKYIRSETEDHDLTKLSAALYAKKSKKPETKNKIFDLDNKNSQNRTKSNIKNLNHKTIRLPF